MKYAASFFLCLIFVSVAIFAAKSSVVTSLIVSFIPTVPKVLAESPKIEPIFYFLRDLRQGDMGEDVRQLQKILKISETGVFDAYTTQSVIEFQNKNAEEVLRPVALTQGTGFVGLWTRLKLNQILLKPEVVPISPAVASSTHLLVTFASKYYAPAGTTVTLSGFGFSTRANTIHVGKKYQVANIAAKSESELTFTIPENVAVGMYDISVSNDSFKKPSNGMPFIVTTAGAQLPAIESIDVAGSKKAKNVTDLLFAKENVITFGQKITITGKNFTAKDNMIVSNIGTFSGLSSPDGKTLTFTIPVPEYLAIDNADVKKAWFAGKNNLNWTARFVVANTNGISAHTESAKCIINI